MSLTLHYDFTQAPVATGVLEALNSKGPDLTVTRASTATFTDWESNLRTVQANEPRITGARRVENIAEQSADFGTGWAGSGATITTDQYTDPDGGSAMDKVTASSGSAQHMTYTGGGMINSVNGASDLTASVYVRYDNHDWVFLRVTAGANDGASFNISTGEKGALSANATDSYIEEISAGLYRIGVTVSTGTAATQCAVALNDSGAGSLETWNAAGTEAIGVWGFQLEEVSGQADPSPSEYVATTTAAAYKVYDSYKPAPSSVTNLCLQSQDFSTTWTPAGLKAGTPDADVALAPDGLNTADLITEDNATTSHRVYQLVSVAAGTDIAFSCYVKRESGTRNLYLIANNGAPNIQATFNLGDGTLIGSSDNGDATLLSAGIEPASLTYPEAPDGWYRCWITGTWSAGTANTYLQAYMAQGTHEVSAPSYAGDNASGLYLWGAQLEKAHHGANSVPSTYIPTTTQAESSYRTNLCLQSQTFDTTWVATRASISADATTAPDGTTTADELIEDGTATNTHNVSLTQQRPESLNKTHCLSVHMKANARTNARIWLRHESNSSGYLKIDLGSGVIDGADAVWTSYGIEDKGDGWYRVYGIYTVGATDTTSTVIQIHPDDGTYASYSGDGSSSIYIWGAQLEATAAPVPSTYIATTTAAQSNNFASNSVDGTALDTAPTGLLVEEARTNLILRSEEFDDAAWDKGSCTVDADAAVAPDGATSMDRLNVTAASAKHELVNNAAITTTSDTDYAVSAFVKDDGAGFFGIYFGNGATTGKISAVWDLSNGVLGETDVGSTSGTVTSTSIEDYGNGIYRVCIVGQYTGTVSYASFFTSDSATPTYDGGRATYLGVAGEDVFCWGAQVEAGSFPTSYIATEGTSVTRNADVVKTTDVSWYNDDEGTFFVNGQRGAVNSTFSAFLNATDNSSSDRWSMATWDGNNQPNLYVKSSSALYVDLNSSEELAAGVSSNLVSAVAANDAELYVDGVRSGTGDQGVVMPVGVSLFAVGSYNGSSTFLNGHIAEIRYYDTRLPNAVLDAMSNGTFPLEVMGSRMSLGLQLTIG